MSFDVIAGSLSAGLGYLIGSLSFGYWIAKANGVDIFAVGSKSPGATNVKRSVGKAAGNLVFALDFLKGLVATGWPILMYSNTGYSDGYGLIGLFTAVIGHSFSLFTGFRGGKGVAAMLGGVVALMPIAESGVIAGSQSAPFHLIRSADTTLPSRTDAVLLPCLASSKQPYKWF